MAEYKVVKVPKDGAKITMGANKKLQVPDNPIIPFIEGDGTGPRYLARVGARVRCGGGEGLRGQKENPLDGSVRRGKVVSSSSIAGCPTKPCRRSGVSRRHQRAADHADRRRHHVRSTWRCASCSISMFASGRCATSTACRRRSSIPSLSTWWFFARTPKTFTPASSFPTAPKPTQVQIAAQRKLSKRICQDSLSQHRGHRLQAGFRRRHRAAGARGDPVGAGEQAQEHQLCPQRQHHEIHRGRVHGLGLCPRQARISQRRRHRARVVDPG